MNCVHCGRTNRAGARFCGGCGGTLAPRCPTCGSESEPDAQFCDACGAALVAHATHTDEGGARKVVTIIFADLIGSTALHERLDAESTRRLMDRYYQALRSAVEGHGGTVVKLLGDGVMAAFGVPRVAEDDAMRAVRAAVAMQHAFRALMEESAGAPLASGIGLRVAVNTGEVVVSAANDDVVGDPVNVAARLQQEAHDGEVLIGEATRRLVSELVTLLPFGTLALKGRAETVAAYRVVSLDRPAGAPTIAFVGRDDDLRRIMAVYDAAVAGSAGRLVVILGSPGLGKSRLIDEFIRRLRDRAIVLTAHCDPAGGATFAPVAKAVRTLLGVDDATSGDTLRAAITAAVPCDDSEHTRIADGISALLTGTPTSPEETFFVARRFLTVLAASQPVVLTIDDLQWAEPLLLDLIEHLVQWSTGVPLLLLAAARPELRDTRSSLTTAGALVTDVLTLAGLDAGAATRLAANVIGAGELPAAIAGRVLTTSEGNPLFVGELVRMLVNDGALRREGDQWTAAVDLADLQMPPTIHALLAARIERLRSQERIVVERASVIGRQFSRAAVAHLLPRDAHADLDTRLESLRRSELIEPDTGWFLGEPALRFHHALIRDAAYRRLLKGTRAELHGRFADWLESRGGKTVEHDETIGWHLEQAHQHLRELGPIDERGRAFGERAAHYLAAAGRRALGRDDLSLAASLLGRALDQLDGADPARANLALDWCEALLAAGDVGAAAAAIAELGRFIADSDRLRAWHTCFAGQLAALTDPQALRATADAVAAAADELASARDAAGEAKAHSVHALALARLGKIGGCEAALDKALAAARRAGDRRRANAVLAGAPLAALWGPSPVTRASGRCLDVVRVLRITQGAPAVEAVALRCQGVLEALRGRTDAAQRMIASSRRMVEELGITQRLLEADVFAGLIELLEGNADAAERCLRGAYTGLREHGLAIDAAQAAALLGRALLAQGNAEEAEALSHESEALAGDDLKAAIAWRGVRAEALARRGEHAAAVDLARTAVDIAAATDALLDHADARLALAVALRAAGQGEAANAEELRAIELWEAKGATLLAQRARRDAGCVDQVGRAPDDRAEPERPARRRVRANAATANAARLDAAIAARDLDAVANLFADSVELVHRPTGAVYDRHGVLFSLRSLSSAQDMSHRIEPLATLGESLALGCLSTSFSAASEEFAPFGAVEREHLLLFEVDASGRQRQAEFFAADRLNDAVARLYDRYVDVLPDGPQRARAAATARSVATLLGPLAVDRYATAIAPAFRYVDHRRVGFGSARGAEAILRAVRTILETADNVDTRSEDVLALRPDMLLQHGVNFGTERASGGAYETHILQLWVFGADGRLMLLEEFDPDREAEALARFDELGPAEGPTIVMRIGNAATRTAALVDAAWAAHDWERFAALFHREFRNSDRRWMVHLEINRDQYLDSLRQIFDIASNTSEVLGTRGNHLAMLRVKWKANDDQFGSSEGELVSVSEVDEAGQCTALVYFDHHNFEAAYAELDARYAVGEAASHPRARTTIDRMMRAVATRDWDDFAAVHTPDLIAEDHRKLGWGRLGSRDEYVQRLRAVVELAPDAILRFDHVLAMHDSAVLSIGAWRATREGGAFVLDAVSIAGFSPDGRIAQAHFYELDQLDAARARFNELAATPLPLRRDESAAPTTRCLENAATRAWHRLDAAWKARNWERYAGLYPPGFRLRDRRKKVRLDLDREHLLESVRPLFEMPHSSLTWAVLGTRGNRLALMRWTWIGSDALVGASETESLGLMQVDEAGNQTELVMFDIDDLDAAFAEVDERYAAGEAAPYAQTWATIQRLARAAARRDWEEYFGAFVADLILEDHRKLGWGTIRSRDEYAHLQRAVVDLAPNAILRFNHVLAMSDHAALTIGTWMGTRDGGRFELGAVSVPTFGPDGLIPQSHLYDVEDLDAARARYETLAASADGAHEAPQSPLANAATHAVERAMTAWEARDWERFAALIPTGFRSIDRRPLVQLDLDRDEWVASYRQIVEMTSAQLTKQVFATRGDRLALVRVDWRGLEQAIGPSEISWLLVIEVDERGYHRLAVTFNPDDLDAAYAELDARYAAAAADSRRAGLTRAFTCAFAARDWDALAVLLAPDLVVNDHRLLGWETLHGPAAYIQALKQLVDLAPDVRLRIDHLTMSDPRFLYGTTWVGTREGGAFETPSIIVCELDAMGRICRFDQYDPDQLNEASALFAAPRAAEPNPLAPFPAREGGRMSPASLPASGRNPERGPAAALAKPNAATAAMDRVQAAFEARDWAAMRTACRADVTLEDRRRRCLISGDLDFWVAERQRLADADVHYARQLVGTAGDRVALERMLWTGGTLEGPDEIARLWGRYEIEHLWLTEVDEAGLIVSCLLFDLDDWRAAHREARTRVIAADDAAGLGPTFKIIDAWNAHDRAGIRPFIADDYVVEDHRRVSMGRIEGADAFLDSLAALWELAPDIQLDPLFTIACERYGGVTLDRLYGTLREGGEFENLVTTLTTVACGRGTRIEFFEIGDVDAARARFTELRPDPLRIPPNVATRASDRWQAVGEAQDWNALEALYAPTCGFDDRRRATRTSGDRTMHIANTQYIFSQRARPVRTVLATSGDRLALEHHSWTRSDDVPAFEIALLCLTEVDADGRTVARILFDPDDRRAASLEMFERYFRSDAGMVRQAVEFRRALAEHDLGRLRASLPDDFSFHDHRRTGGGRIEGADAYVAWLGALFEQSPDAIIEPLYYVATEPHGFLAIAHTFGTNASGGEFESVYGQLALYEGDRIVSAELFEIDDLDVARARFEELRPR